MYVEFVWNIHFMGLSCFEPKVLDTAATEDIAEIKRGCLRMFKDVQGCSRMSEYILKCLRKSKDVLGCLRIS